MGHDVEDNLNAKFFVRILPSVDFSDEGIKIEANCRVMHVKCLQKRLKLKKQEKQKYWCFIADDIFWNRSQEDIYESVCGCHFVENILGGVSGVILAYGQTGTGKTFTISGLRHHYQNRGLVLRLLTSLCNEREANRDVKKITIRISYAEFINKKVKDLLRNTYVEKLNDIKKAEVRDEIDAWKSIFESEVRKSVNETAPYMGSHRGHTVLTFHVESLSLIESSPLPYYSKVHIVDMSGIDSIGNAASLWRANADLEYSNMSKTMMEQLLLCISGRTWRAPNCVCPIKATKMLEYLQDTLRPYCMIRFIGHVFGNEQNLPLTLSVLRFGEKICGIKPTQLEKDVTKNDLALTLRLLEEEVERLRQELDFSDMLNDSPNYTNMSQERLQQIRRAAKNFLLGHVDNLTLLHLGQARITLDVFKEVYENLGREKDQAVKDAVLATIEEFQTQYASERSHSIMMPAAMRMSRRRTSRQREIRVSTIQAPIEVEGGVSRTSAAPGPGVLDKRGISIGTAKVTNSYEGLVTKSMKRLRSRMSDVVVRPVPRSSSAKEMGVPTSEISLQEKVPSKEEAWQEFCTEKSDLVQAYREEISKLEDAVRAAKKNYTVALCELGRVKENLERLKREQDGWNHIRQMCKVLEHDSMEEATASYDSTIEKKEIELNNAMENCHVTLIDFRNSTDELAEAKAALENEFQIFCGDMYRIGMIPEEESSADLLSAESAGETTLKYDTKMEMYFQFQAAMINYVPRRAKPKWVGHF